MIIGVTGYNCAGKDTAANILMQTGFRHISLSDILRRYMTDKGIPITRETLRIEGNKLREEQGNNILAKMALTQTEKNKNYVITSIRNPTEATHLKQQPSFKLIAITAPTEIRYQRFQQRPREEDNAIKTIQDFTHAEQLMMSNNPAHQQLHTVNTMADYTIDNSGTPEDLKQKLYDLLKL